MLTRYPYLLRGTWVFDDRRTGLKEEAFVFGMTEMISRLAASKGIPGAERGFALAFSNDPTAARDAVLKWVRSDDPDVRCERPGSGSVEIGNWYRGVIDGQEMEGWLCPALGLYFQGVAPKEIFVRADPLPPGVEPIWLVEGGEAIQRFISAPDGDDPA